MKIVFLGDSITQGIPGVSYVSMVEKSLPQYEIVNRGVGGDTVSSLQKRVKKMNDLLTFDYIVLFIGVNDVFGKLTNSYKILKTLKRQKWAKDIQEFQLQYIELVTYIKSKNKQLILIPPLLIGEDINNPWNKELKKLIKIIQDIARQEHLTYLDVYHEYTTYLKDQDISSYLPMKIPELLKDVKNLSNPSLVDAKSKERGLHLTLDGVHINSKGAKMISDAVIQYLESVR
jgi:lysophospholipase L1-like esterase